MLYIYSTGTMEILKKIILALMGIQYNLYTYIYISQYFKLIY